VGEGTNATVNITAGTVTLGAASGGLVLGRSTATAQGFMNISGGSLVLSGNGNLVRIGAGYTNAENSGASVLTISGTGHFNAGTTTGTIQLGSGLAGNTASTGTIHLNGGTLSTLRTIMGGTVGASIFNFNGGTLKATGATMTLATSLTTVNVRDGGGGIDTSGFNVSILKGLTHSTIEGDAAIDGGITKSGAGVLTFGGTEANTYTGVTRVYGGELALSKTAGVNAIAGDITIGDGTTTALLRLVNADQIANTSVITLQGLDANAGVFRLNGKNETIGGLVSVNGEGIVENESTTNAVLTLNNTGTQSYSGILRNGSLSGVLSLIKTGTGTQILASATTYTGITTINAGTLKFGVNNALNSTTPLVLAAAGGQATLSLDGHSWATGGITIYNATSTSTSQAVIDLGEDGLLTLGAATVTVNNDNNPLGATITGGTIDFGTTTRTFAIADSSNAIADLTIESDIITGAGSIGLIKTGAGTLRLSGTVSLNGTVTLSTGVLEIAGTTSHPPATFSTTVGSATGPAVLRIVNGGDYTTGALNLGVGPTLKGASLVVTGGVITMNPTSTQSGVLLGSTGYGGMFLSGGTINTKRVDSGDGTTEAAISILRVDGGTLNTSRYIMFRNERWEFTVTGGQVVRSNEGIALAFRSGATVATATATAQGAMTVAGGVVDNGLLTLTFGQQNDASALGTAHLNLNAGTFINNRINFYNNTGMSLQAFVNFNGGLWRVTQSTALISTVSTGGTGSIKTYVNGAFGNFAGGAVIDSNGFTPTISNALLAPTGNGVTSITVTGGGSGYIGAPYVEISGGGGTGATAYATVDLDPSSPTYGQITGIVVTNPGRDYTSTPTIVLKGGGGTGAIVGTVSTATNTSGGLTKLGTGTLILSGTDANTYTGMTSVNAGELHLSKTDGVTAVAGDITVGTGSGSAILKLINSNQISDTSAITFNGTGANAGVFRLNNRSDTVGGLSSTGGAGIVENEFGVAGESTLTVNVTTGTKTFTGVIRNGDGTGIDGTLALAKTGAGTQVLTANNTYTGATTITEGTLQLGNGGATGSVGAADIEIGAQGTLTINRSDQYTLVNHIKGSGSLAVNSPSTGTVVIDSVGNTYSGGTRVNSGTLMLLNAYGTGTGTGSVTVEAAGKLAGNGYITTSAGNSVVVRGTFSIGQMSTYAEDFHVETSGGGAFLVEAGGVLVFDITSGAGSGMLNAPEEADMLYLSGNVVLQTGSTLRVDSLYNLADWALGDAWQIIDWTSLGVTTRTGTFSHLDLPELSTDLDWDVSQLYSAGIISIGEAAAVPEPGRALLLAGACVMMILRRRRR
jgi:autotransporter-associated beta strand protein